MIEVHNTERVIVDPDFPGDKRCKLCNRVNNIFVLEKHHILPKGWGGPTTESESARGTVWDYADANCHNSVHLILNHMKKVGEWDQGYIEHWDFPYGVIRYAKAGWQRYIALLESKEANGAEVES